MPPNTPLPNDGQRPPSSGSLPVAKRLPPLAPQTPPTTPRRPPAPPDDSGFEVVDDTASIQSAGTDAGADFEVVDDEPPKKKKPAAAVEDDDDAPRPKKRSRRDDDDDAPRPKKKKRRRDLTLTPEDEEAEQAKDNAIHEWGVPLSLMLFGLGMMMFAAFRMGKADAGVAALSTAAMFGFTFLYALVIIPVTIVALMVIGMMIGIEYGTPLSAIRNLAAICFISNGIMFLGSSFAGGMAGIIAIPIAGVVSFGLFMTLFRLDVWETWISLVGLNLMSKALQFLMLIVMAALAAKAARSGGGFDRGDDPDPPAWNQKNQWNQPPQGGRQPQFEPDDDN